VQQKQSETRTVLGFGRARARRAQSPDGDRGRQCERRDHKSEVEPGPISLGSPGRHEKMDHNPQTHGKPQSKRG
jgi:hypothetical protein